MTMADRPTQQDQRDGRRQKLDREQERATIPPKSRNQEIENLKRLTANIMQRLEKLKD